MELGRCVENETPERPSTRYGFAKLAAWKTVETAALDNFRAAEARIFFAYGPGENRERLIPYICRSHVAGAIPQLSSGVQLRDLLHVEDTAAAILAIAESEEIDGPVNIGGGRPVTLGQVATWLAAIAGDRETGLGPRPGREGDPRILVPDVARLTGIGWQPSIEMGEGLERTFRWWRKASATDV